MSYYCEVWLRGYARNELHTMSGSPAGYHAHITLGRPFRPLASEENVRRAALNYCKGKSPVPIRLGELRTFPQGTPYISVESPQLHAFSDGLEAAIESEARFKPKLSETKILHATVLPTNALHSMDFQDYMLRLTAIRDGLIWFSYDLVTQAELCREQSLDKMLWLDTIKIFSEMTGLEPTPQGFRRL